MITKIFDFLRHGSKPFQGVVIRKNHPKTLMVEVGRQVFNKTKYGGLQIIRRNLMVHDEYDICHIGDIVRIKQSKRYSKKKAHEVYDILRPYEPTVFMQQNPEYSIPRTARKDRKKREKTLEIELQDPITQARLQKEADLKEKDIVAKKLARLERRKQAQEALKKKTSPSQEKQKGEEDAD
jgi:ribosomal protein S17